jgi:hypothetical protein
VASAFDWEVSALRTSFSCLKTSAKISENATMEQSLEQKTELKEEMPS